MEMVSIVEDATVEVGEDVAPIVENVTADVGEGVDIILLIDTVEVDITAEDNISGLIEFEYVMLDSMVRLKVV